MEVGQEQQKRVAEREELERMQRDLEDLEMYLQEFNTFLPLAVCTVSPAGVLIDVNSAFEKATGYEAHEATGKKVNELFYESEAVADFLERLQSGEGFSKSIQVTLVREDGAHRVVDITASTRSDRSGQFLGFFVGISDITELKHLQDELEDEVADRTRDLQERTKELERSRRDIMRALAQVETERSRTQSLVQNLTDGLIYLDKNNVVGIVNPQARAMLRVHDEEVVGETLENLSAFERMTKLSSLLSSSSSLDREVLSFTEDFIVEVTTVSVQNDDKQDAGRLVILHDISKERALDNLKVEFISVATHQMRTPLAAIKWAFELLLASDDDKLAPDLKKIAENGFESTQRILKIVNNFLDVDAMESVNVDYLFAPVNIKKVLEKVLIDVSIQAREKGIELVFENENDDLPYLQADQEQLANVLQNLIENALKYTIQEGRISIRAEVREQDMLISVADQGIGISQSESQNIFTKFFRAENAKKVETDGNGLGLYTTKRIVEKHGGRIWFESQMGAGTTFYFTIPLYNQ